LSEEAEVYLTLPEQELETDRWRELKEILGDVFVDVISYRYSPSAKRAGNQLGEALTIHYRNDSLGYKTRQLNKFFIGLDMPINWLSQSGFCVGWTRRGELARRFSRELPSLVRGTKLFLFWWSKFAVKKIRKNCSLNDLSLGEKHDAVIILMQRQAGFVVAAVEGCISARIPSLMIPVKWDNATSKSPFVRVPSRMLVYNQHVGGVCSRLHRMPVKSVVPVGSVEVGIGKQTSLPRKRRSLVLIGGTADSSSSEPWLKSVASVVGNIEIEGNLGIETVWRPYPTTDESSIRFMKDFLFSNHNFRLDQDILNKSSHRASGRTFAEVRAAYERFCQLLQDATLVVSECTSVIIDARARGVPVIVPAFRRDAVIGSQWHFLNGFEHLQGLVTTGGVFIAEDEVELERLLTDFLTNPRRIPPDNTGENIFVDHRSYARRVLDVVEDVLSER